jgi:small subunit ribosomal protein S14|uniref:Small ribosomal subunit protein uS14c n=1 Tax=Pycnococcus provasolii TaxID=41880 RepID=C0JWY1_9CHLO|nr:ribosomal protein S14 [Pycnococcus provasolii]ACK36837.1 ribosomal protein S14 [Pycnococcus provasolii]
MAKKAMIERERKRQRLVAKFQEKRAALREAFKTTESFEEKLALQQQLQKLPRNSSRVRLNRRCNVSGRPKAVYRHFGLSRHVLRELAHQGLLPGVRKASW